MVVNGKSLMFDFVDKKRPNPIGGKCYGCTYCYIHGKRGMVNRFPNIKKKYTRGFKLYPDIINKKLVNVVKPLFFCDCIDWLHIDMPNAIIARMLGWFNEYPDIEFLSLTKNPMGYHKIMPLIPDNLILGVTIESNRNYCGISNAPSQSERISLMIQLEDYLKCWNKKNKIFISIEPIMPFDFYEFHDAIERINPTFGVAIGYSNNSVKLFEPPLKDTMVLRKNLIYDQFKVYDKTLRKAHWEK